MDRELRHFILVAEKGSVSTAASALGLSQSALTKSLQRLEARLGVSLLERGVRGSTLTAEGEAILARARSVEAEYRYLEIEASEFRAEALRHIRIGASPAWGSSVLPRVVAGIRALYPGIRIDTAIDLEQGILDALRQGAVDFALCGAVPGPAQKGIAFHPLQPIDTLVVCRNDHPLVATWTGDVSALFRCDWLDYRAALDRRRGRSEALSKSITGIISQTQSWSLVPILLAETDLLAVLPEHLEEYLRKFGLRYLDKGLKISTINTGVWCRTSIAETRVGKVVLARLKSETARSIPARMDRRMI